MSIFFTILIALATLSFIAYPFLKNPDKTQNQSKSSEDIMFCPKCGAEQRKGDIFCPRCGASLTEKAENDE